MKVQGRIKRLMPIQSGISRVGNSWRRQDFILEFFEKEEDRYADSVVLSLMNEKIEDYALQEGEDVLVEIRHNVKAYNERVYTELWIRSLERVKTTPTTSDSEPVTQQVPQQMNEDQTAAIERLKKLGEQATSGKETEDDELPF